MRGGNNRGTLMVEAAFVYPLFLLNNCNAGIGTLETGADSCTVRCYKDGFTSCKRSGISGI